MKAMKRREYIYQLATKTKSVKVTDLVDELGVSDQTIRRDLKSLEEDGKMTLVFGGAYINQDNNVPSGQASDNAVIIRDLALNQIKNEDVIFLSGSSLSYMLATQLTEMKVSVVTNSLEIADLLSGNSNVNVHFLSGRIDKNNGCSYGEFTLAGLRLYRFDRVFISPHSLSSNNGLVGNDRQDKVIWQLAMRHGTESYCLIEETMLEIDGVDKVSDLDTIDYIVTNKRPNILWQEISKTKGIKLLYEESNII